MGRKNKVDINQFLIEWKQENKTDQELMNKYQISKYALARYKVIANKAVINEVTTEYLEKQTLELYQNSKDVKTKISLLGIMADIWKSKHKIPQKKEEEEKIDIGAFLNGINGGDPSPSLPSSPGQ